MDNTNTTEYRKGRDLGIGTLGFPQSQPLPPLSLLMACAVFPLSQLVLQHAMAHYLIRQPNFSFGNSSSMGWSGHLIIVLQGIVVS